MNYEPILVETRERVGLIRLNRMKGLNVLNGTLLHELMAALDAFDANDKIGAIVIAAVSVSVAPSSSVTSRVTVWVPTSKLTVGVEPVAIWLPPSLHT